MDAVDKAIQNVLDSIDSESEVLDAEQYADLLRGIRDEVEMRLDAVERELEKRE